MLCRLSLASLTVAALVSSALAGAADANPSKARLETMIVSARPALSDAFTEVGALTTLSGELVEGLAPVHGQELFVRVPGAWVSRGSGQEHLMALRSPVLAGPGACGAFLLLEDGIPLRPAGFCNVNNLFEMNLAQASGVEVLRGPGSALYGGTALLGAVNVRSAAPAAELAGPEGMVQAELGPWSYGGLQGQVAAPLGEERVLATFDVVDTDGWQDDTGFRHRKGSVRAQGEWGAWRHDFQLSGASLDQNTGGFVVGPEAFADATLRNTNPNPEAYREAYALRASLGLERDLPTGAMLGITPYARRSEMEFFQHFLPGQPLEENGQDSLGVIARVAKAGERWRGTVGLQLEWADTWLTQRQDGPTVGSAFLVATRPEGQHYDYAVESALAAAFYDVSLDLSPRLTLVHSARLEQLRYDYDNRMLAGNTQDDGTACGFGGCNYSRPEDRKDRFTDQAGRLGVVYGLTAHSQLAFTASAGFRAPQSTELYRLQSGQTVADLRSEFVRSFELAYGYARDGFTLSLTAFDQRAEDQVLRDAEGFNISAGKTDSDGVEGQLSYAIYPTLSLAAQVTYARHRYAFSQDLGRGEAIQKGDDVDTAPRWLGSAQLRWTPSDAVSLELENVTMGDYFMDAGNTARYDGHRVWNLRGRYALSDQLTVALRILNLADERYAERADLAFGNERYFVGQPQRAHLSVRYDF